jgi:hypothetical protein
MLSALITLIVFLLIASLLWWILSLIPLPAPIKQVATVIFVVICCLVLIYFLLGLTHTGISLR